MLTQPRWRRRSATSNSSKPFMRYSGCAARTQQLSSEAQHSVLLRPPPQPTTAKELATLVGSPVCWEYQPTTLHKSCMQTCRLHWGVGAPPCRAPCAQGTTSTNDATIVSQPMHAHSRPRASLIMPPSRGCGHLEREGAQGQAGHRVARGDDVEEAGLLDALAQEHGHRVAVLRRRDAKLLSQTAGTKRTICNSPRGPACPVD